MISPAVVPARVALRSSRLWRTASALLILVSIPSKNWPAGRSLGEGWWEDLRKLHNLTTHEYPDDDLALHSTITKVIRESEKLLKYWQELKAKLQPLIA